MGVVFLSGVLCVCYSVLHTLCTHVTCVALLHVYIYMYVGVFIFSFTLPSVCI